MNWQRWTGGLFLISSILTPRACSYHWFTQFLSSSMQSSLWWCGFTGPFPPWLNSRRFSWREGPVERRGRKPTDPFPYVLTWLPLGERSISPLLILNFGKGKHILSFVLKNDYILLRWRPLYIFLKLGKFDKSNTKGFMFAKRQCFVFILFQSVLQ